MMRNAAHIFLFIGRFILFPVYFLSGFYPRRRDLWVYGSWGGYRFADNSAAFFLYCQEEIGNNIKLVWISRDRSIVQSLREKGYCAYWIWSPGGMLACLQAKVHLFDCFSKDTNFWLSRGADKICLWSGVPLKVFERDIDNTQSRYYRLFHGSLPERWLLGMMMPWHVDKPDLIIATSKENGDITKRAFGLPEGRVVTTGFPRNDILLNKKISIADSGADLPDSFINAMEAGGKIFLYLPTFRDSGKEYMNIDWQQLDQLMHKVGAKLFFKTHPMDRLKNDVRLDNIIQLPQTTDVYNLLPNVDVLISDYSSVIFDYMLLARPIIYYMPDLDSFLSENRSLLFQPEEIAVGPICSDFEALLQTLEEVALHQPEVNSTQREQTMQRLFAHVDSNSSQRVLRNIDSRFYAGKLLDR
jgi:CDP-glycerol glycerophosphotransferase (TagB/SpsB family)